MENIKAKNHQLQRDPSLNEGFTYKPGNALPLGVSKNMDGIQFAVYLPDRRQCALKLYRIGSRKPAYSIQLSQEFRWGSIYHVTITSIDGEEERDQIARILSRDYEYLYEADGEDVLDPYTAVLHGRQSWGKKPSRSGGLRSGISLEDFAWQDDCQLRQPYTDLILYQLHVRGYTRHSSSGVEHKGTFLGLQEKIPYLKELGVNGVLLLPCYEFNEIQSVEVLGCPKEFHGARGKKASGSGMGQASVAQTAVGQGQAEKTGAAGRQQVKLNYWGYGGDPVFYFAPKASYAWDAQNPVWEMKEMVRTFHQNGIEVLMDIYFSPGTNLSLMTECLRYWVMEYHIDGFRVNQEVLPAKALVADPVLCGIKLLTSYWDEDMLKQSGAVHQGNALAEYNEGFMNDARRFLKSDEGMVGSFVYRFCRNPEDFSVINFITHVNGFTLMDLVSYDVKHNEENGEQNQDGTDYNYSWNCGAEGKTRKKTITSRRMLQIRNAFLMLLLGQGTPMILAGDEFGNSQNGNNNPYCQDNPISWLNWGPNRNGQEILEYVKRLIRFRREHPVLRQKRQLQQYDSLSCGMPDLSIHGVRAWKADYSSYNRMLGILLYGDYQKDADGVPDDSIYIIYNMYWESRSFDLPNLPEGREWYVAIETYDNTFTPAPQRVHKKSRKKKPSLENNKKTIVPPRSIVVFIGK